MKAGSAWALALTVALAPLAAAQQPSNAPDGPMTENPRYNQSQSPRSTPPNSAPPRSEAPPRSNEESSSDQTRIDLSPPEADAVAHPEGGRMADDAIGVHEWNPMRAMKDVEVGDYYYNLGNYKAALSRYREALQYKPRDAVATFKLARTLEKSRQFEQARAQYEAYLEILKDGPSAGEARKALKRLQKQ
jgi:tetratricopeptide (TPR) repeat protein